MLKVYKKIRLIHKKAYGLSKMKLKHIYSSLLISHNLNLTIQQLSSLDSRLKLIKPFGNRFSAYFSCDIWQSSAFKESLSNVFGTESVHFLLSAYEELRLDFGSVYRNNSTFKARQFCRFSCIIWLCIRRHWNKANSIDFIKTAAGVESVFQKLIWKDKKKKPSKIILQMCKDLLQLGSCLEFASKTK